MTWRSVLASLICCFKWYWEGQQIPAPNPSSPPSLESNIVGLPQPPLEINNCGYIMSVSYDRRQRRDREQLKAEGSWEGEQTLQVSICFVFHHLQEVQFASVVLSPRVQSACERIITVWSDVQIIFFISARAHMEDWGKSAGLVSQQL